MSAAGESSPGVQPDPSGATNPLLEEPPPLRPPTGPPAAGENGSTGPVVAEPGTTTGPDALARLPADPAAGEVSGAPADTIAGYTPSHTPSPTAHTEPDQQSEFAHADLGPSIDHTLAVAAAELDDLAANGAATDDTAQGARQRASLRSTLATLSTRMNSERILRANEAAQEAADSAAASQLAADTSTEPTTGERRHPLGSPFRVGFLGGLGVLLAFVAYQVLDTIRGTLILIAVSALIAIGLDPFVARMVRRGLRRGAAVTVVFLLLVVGLGGAFYAIVPPIVSEVITFVGSLPVIIEELQNNPTIQNLDERFGLLEALRSSDIVQNVGSGAAGGILAASVTLAGVFVDLLIVLILTLYFLAGFPRIKASAYRLAPASKRARVTDLGEKIFKQMGGYLGGATIISIQAGIIAGAFAAIIGLPYPLAIGLGAAVLDFIPVVGPIIIGIAITLLGFTKGLVIGITAGVFYLCQHLFEAYWLYPRVMRRTVDISTGAVVVAILIGASLLGVMGAILAVPVAAGIILIVREVVMPKQERS